MVIHLILVRLDTLFTEPRWFQGQFNIITLAIEAFDQVTDVGLQYNSLSDQYLTAAALLHGFTS